MSADDDHLNIVDAYCLSLFPEMRERFSESELRGASALGSYIFHEDFFMRLVIEMRANEALMARVGRYVEYLSTDSNTLLGDLAEIGILEGAVSQNLHTLAPHLGPASRSRLERVLSHFDVDARPWRG